MVRDSTANARINTWFLVEMVKNNAHAKQQKKHHKNGSARTHRKPEFLGQDGLKSGKHFPNSPPLL